jgi:hypothetical protein
LFFFDLQRLGLEDGATYTVSIEPLNDAIASVSAPLEYSNLEILETVNGAFTYTLKEGILSGAPVDYLFSVNNGLATFSDTIRKVYGTPIVIFEDTASNFNNWISSKWNITTSQSHSPATSIADSPIGQYTNNENNIITLAQPIDLSDVVYASLSFWAKWDVEAGYDFVQVMISDNNGSTWTPVEGKYSHPGNSNQNLGEPLYDGTQSAWVKEDISLEPYLDKQIKIRFVLKSDTYVVADGFFWDDMTVTVVDLETGVDDNMGNGGSVGTQNFASLKVQPNPASGSVTFDYLPGKFETGTVNMKIYDLTGHQVFETALTGETGDIKLDISSWPTGLYFYAISYNRAVIESGKFIVR